MRNKYLTFFTFCLLIGAALSLPAMNSAKKDGDIIPNLRYRSWRNSLEGHTVVYSIVDETSDRMERTIMEKTLDRFTIKFRHYSGDRLVEEKTEEIRLDKIRRNLDMEKLKEEGIEMSEARRMVLKSLHDCQVFRYPDGHVEVISGLVPAGGVVEKINPDGQKVMEIKDIREERITGSQISEISRVSEIKPRKSAMNISELIQGLKQEENRPAKSSKRIVIGEDETKEEETSSNETFYVQTVSKNPKTASRFISSYPLMTIGFDIPGATAKYHLTIKNLSEKSDKPVIPKTITIKYDKKVYSEEDNTPVEAVIRIISDSGESTEVLPLKAKPFPEMRAFELPPEVVNIIPGNFSCFHIRLVLAQPEETIEIRDETRIRTLADRKIDYWISNVENAVMVVKKEETVKEKVVKTPVNDPSNILESTDQTILKKWSLAEYIPAEK